MAKKSVVGTVELPPGIAATVKRVEEANAKRLKLREKLSASNGEWKTAIDELLKSCGSLPLFDRAVDDDDEDGNGDDPPEP
jgi:hypothetical protein